MLVYVHRCDYCVEDDYVNPTICKEVGYNVQCYKRCWTDDYSVNVTIWPFATVRTQKDRVTWQTHKHRMAVGFAEFGILSIPCLPLLLLNGIILTPYAGRRLLRAVAYYLKFVFFR